MFGGNAEVAFKESHLEKCPLQQVRMATASYLRLALLVEVISWHHSGHQCWPISHYWWPRCIRGFTWPLHDSHVPWWSAQVAPWNAQCSPFFQCPWPFDGAIMLYSFILHKLGGISTHTHTKKKFSFFELLMLLNIKNIFSYSLERIFCGLKKGNRMVDVMKVNKSLHTGERSKHLQGTFVPLVNAALSVWCLNQCVNFASARVVVLLHCRNWAPFSRA